MHVLVTGHRGYVGPWVVRHFQEAGHRVTGCDVGYFEGCRFDLPPLADTEWRCDFRELGPRQLERFDAVIHLAALSNDPLGALDPELTRAVNLTGSVQLARAAKCAGVPRFLLAGSCSVYGRSPDEALAVEQSPLSPLSTYAESKILAERGIGCLADRDFSPVFLRNATAYGYSPMLRIDLVINHLLASAFAAKTIPVRSDGSPWRPFLHVADMAKAFLAVAEGPRELTAGLAINIGWDEDNLQVRDVAEMARELVPDARITYQDGAAPDPRNYRVSFGRMRRLFPNLRPLYNVRSGMADLLDHLRRHGFTDQDLHGDRYVRLRVLERRLHDAPPPLRTPIRERQS